MVISEAERAAAAKVLRRWRSGRLILTAYAVGAGLPVCLLAILDHSRDPVWDHSRNLMIASAGMVAAGIALLVVVSFRNAWAGDDLAEWRPELLTPEDLAGDVRLARTGGYAYVLGLLTTACAALLLQNIWANGMASETGTAQVTKCTSSRSRAGVEITCYGEWSVDEKTYSGKLPGVIEEYEPVTISYDPEDPSSLGGRSLRDLLIFTVMAGVATGVLTSRWILRVRGPYIDEVEWVARRRARKRST